MARVIAAGLVLGGCAIAWSLGYIVGLRHGFRSGFSQGLLTAGHALEHSARGIKEVSSDAAIAMAEAAKTLKEKAYDVPT